jgi:hypothetical protein
LLAETHLKNLLNQAGFSKTDKLLLCLAIDNCSAKTVAEIKQTAIANGLRAVTNWNVSQLLKSSIGRAVRVSEGWELTNDGKSYISTLVGPIAAAPILTVAASLRAHLSKISDADAKAFVEEAIQCFERGLYRSAVVLSWVGAVALLYRQVVDHRLIDFNNEATRRDPKWKKAKNADDLSRMGEFDFLQHLEAISLIGKNVKQELEKQLKLRNGCGHPNSLKVAEHMVASHLESLILNVFSTFA